MIPYTITNDSVTVVWQGKPHVVREGAPNFLALRNALLDKRWDEVPQHLTVKLSLEAWAKGRFSVQGDLLFYDGTQLPEKLNRRIVEMATLGEDPTPVFRFWERLQKNPSYRSVQQLWDFLQHQGIPLTEDGCFLAYKAVRGDYKDIHSGTFENKPGAVHEMPRNQISDDPNYACHAGFHVGALQYASTFGGADSRLIICKVDPADVVCVPYDHSAQKMRICRYEVIGNYGGPLPSTTYREETISASGSYGECEEVDEDLDDEDLDDEEDVSTCESCGATYTGLTCYECGEVEEKKPVQLKLVDEMTTTEKSEKRKAAKGFAKFDKMGMDELMKQSIEDLRRYATHGLQIVGASKIAGGKTALVARILEVRE